jgi:hypothetical protein
MINRKVGESVDLPEKIIRYAMANSQSNREASRFLNVAYNTYKKYAKIYIDEPTGKSLFDLHKNQQGSGIRKSASRASSYKKLELVLDGYFPDYPANKLRERLIKHGVIEQKCSVCDFNEMRYPTNTVPLILDWIDGDNTNHRLENLRYLCYNCYYLRVDNPRGRKLTFAENVD